MPSSFLTRIESQLFRVLLLRRLRLLLPPSSSSCRCGRLSDCFGHHRASCAQAGVLGRRGFTARICREAGGRVATNRLVRDLDIGARTCPCTPHTHAFLVLTRFVHASDRHTHIVHTPKTHLHTHTHRDALDPPHSFLGAPHTQKPYAHSQNPKKTQNTHPAHFANPKPFIHPSTFNTINHPNQKSSSKYFTESQTQFGGGEVNGLTPSHSPTAPSSTSGRGGRV